MRNRSRIVSIAGVLGLAVLAGGCVPVPVLRTDFTGYDNVPRVPAASPEPPLPSALDLPQLGGVDGEPGRTDAEGRPVRPSYRVGPLDELVVTVWGREDLGSQVPIGQMGKLRASAVREDGMIVLPFLEPFRVAGKTIEEIRDTVQASYAKLLEKPQIEVWLYSCNSRAVEVTGEVTKPGRYYLCADRLTVGEILSTAGAPTLAADLARGVLTRDGRAYGLDFRGNERGLRRAADVPMRYGDVIYFPRQEERVIYVFGEVIRQGNYPIPPQGLTLLDGLALARGPDTLNYHTGGVYLIRPQPDKTFICYRLKFAEILEGAPVQLASGDRLFVAASGLTRWDRFWKKALPFGSLFRSSINVVPTQ